VTLRMSRSAFFERIKNLLLFPGYEWKVISLEKRALSDVFGSYIWRLVLAGGISQFVGSFFYVRNVLDIDAYRFSFPLVQAMIYVAVQFLVIIAGSLFIRGIAFRFHSEKSLFKAVKLFAFSYTPVLIVFILANLHQVLFIALVPGVYTVYLFRIGCQHMLSTPKIRRLSFSMIYMIVTLGLLFIFTRLFGYLSTIIFTGFNGV